MFFCNELHDCNQNLKLHHFLRAEEHSNELVQRLSALSCFSERQASSFVENLKTLCEDNCVNMHENVFATTDVIQI